MLNNQREVELALIAEFADESEESLLKLPARFIELEANPANMEIINAIFRPIHSLKGNAAFFNLMKAKSLAHEIETLLDKIRLGKHSIDKSTIDSLLKGVDVLVSIVRRCRHGIDEVENPETFSQLLEQIKSISNTGTETCVQLVQQSLNKLHMLNNRLSAQDADAAAELGKVISLLDNSIKVSSAQSTPHIVHADQRMASPLEKIRKILSTDTPQKLSDDDCRELWEHIKELESVVKGDAAKAALAQIKEEYKIILRTAGFDSLLRGALLDLVNKSAHTFAETATTPGQSDAATTGATSSGEESGAEKKTMRVAEEKVDKFYEDVGELVIIREMIGNLQKQNTAFEQAKEFFNELRRIYESFEAVSRDLQAGVLAIRKIPVGFLLQKFPRIVRDITKSSEKEIDLVIQGETVELDKSIIEAVEAPLMHMIRNAADHGIEMPNERVKWGKVRKGTIKVAVIELPDLVEISIEDDGRGLDLVAIRKKAESMGIIDTTSVLSDEQLHNLVFISGLSTATMVTDISGRGVGMDVVRRNLEKIGGTISLSSNPNSGTSIALKIPKNIGTQIVDGFLVRISDEHYILPVKHIEESFTAIRSDFTNVNGNGWCVMRRNTLLPYSSLAALLGDSNMGNQRFEDVTVVVLRSKTALFGLGVDAILGLQQVVLKQVSGMPFTNTLFCGAAITGSGTVSMVLDVEYIIGKGKSL